MRCENVNSIKSKELRLEGSVSATMSQKTAMSIDKAISKMGVGGNMDMENQAVKENSSTLVFSIEF